jgi:hypothetical protein
MQVMRAPKDDDDVTTTQGSVEGTTFHTAPPDVEDDEPDAQDGGEGSDEEAGYGYGV